MTRVLIVEDEYLVALDLQTHLRARGYMADTVALSIEEALTIIEQERFDAAILDVNVARASVWPVAHALLRRRVPFLFLSAYGRQLQRPAAFRGAPLLDKPVAVEELVCALMGLTLPAARHDAYSVEALAGEREGAVDAAVRVAVRKKA